jgi:hypothetical protein
MEFPLFVGSGREARYWQENFNAIRSSSGEMNGKRLGRIVDKEEVSQLGTGGGKFLG